MSGSPLTDCACRGGIGDRSYSSPRPRTEVETTAPLEGFQVAARRAQARALSYHPWIS